MNQYILYRGYIYYTILPHSGCVVRSLDYVDHHNVNRAHDLGSLVQIHEALVQQNGNQYMEEIL